MCDIDQLAVIVTMTDFIIILKWPQFSHKFGVKMIISTETNRSS